jgi:hypothetical protein
MYEKSAADEFVEKIAQSTAPTHFGKLFTTNNIYI